MMSLDMQVKNSHGVITYLSGNVVIAYIALGLVALVALGIFIWLFYTSAKDTLSEHVAIKTKKPKSKIGYSNFDEADYRRSAK